MLVIGLTGGIGSGKSTVAGLFAQHDVPVLDADDVAHDLVVPGSPALDAIRQQFGEDIVTESGQLDRAKLREQVFHDPGKRAQLEAILHPPVRQRIREWLGQQDTCYVIVIIPLLIETGMQAMVDRILVVDCPEAVQVKRVIQRNQLDETLVREILDAQASRETRLREADDVIDNSGNLPDIGAAVAALDQRYRALC